MTHTVALLAVSPAAHAEIKARIVKLNTDLPGQYDHMLMKSDFNGDDILNMHGVGLVVDPDPASYTDDQLDAAVIAMDQLNERWMENKEAQPARLGDRKRALVLAAFAAAMGCAS